MYKLFLLVSLLPLFCVGQKPDPLQVNSMQVILTFKSSGFALGTGFILKRKNKFYLVTTYYNLTQSDRKDSTKKVNPANLSPDGLQVSFHDRNGRQTQLDLPLYDKSNRRLYFVAPHPPAKFNRYNIGFLPINDQRLQFEYVDGDKIDSSWAATLGMSLYVYGYPILEKSNGYCDIMECRVAPVKTYSYNDTYIEATTLRSLNGAMGSPVYLDKYGKRFFIGMLFEQADPNKPGIKTCYVYTSKSVLTVFRMNGL